jgi:ribosomal protein L12E/L44/L45/RPP1/RPP2
MAWEVTTEDVQTVLESHGVKKNESELRACLDEIDGDQVEEAVLAYTDFDDQCNAALSDIEDQLMKAKLIPEGGKNWPMP